MFMMPFAFKTRGVSLWGVKSFGVVQSKICKDTLGAQRVNSSII